MINRINGSFGKRGSKRNSILPLIQMICRGFNESRHTLDNILSKSVIINLERRVYKSWTRLASPRGLVSPKQPSPKKESQTRELTSTVPDQHPRGKSENANLTLSSAYPPPHFPPAAPGWLLQIFFSCWHRRSRVYLPPPVLHARQWTKGTIRYPKKLSFIEANPPAP
jgi:hypothetical protein